MHTKEDALKQKEAEIQAQISDWVKNSGLFKVGDQVRITFELVENSPVAVASFNNGKRVKRWVKVSSELSDQDWKIILDPQISTWCKEFLGIIKKSENKPFNFSEILKQLGWGHSRLYSDSANTSCFARFKLPYRIREVESSVHEKTKYQIFKVSPLYRKK